MKTETELCECLLWRTGQQWPAAGAGAVSAADLGMAWTLLEEVTVNPTIELPELKQDWRYRLLVGHRQNFVHTRTQEKGAVTPKEIDPDLPMSVQESPAEPWVGGGLLQGWGYRM